MQGDERTYDDLVTGRGLDEVASYADGIGPEKARMVRRDDEGRLQEPTVLVDEAHRQGLLVHAYTFRNENAFLPAELRQGAPASEAFAGATGDAPAEYRLFFDLGVDGVFSDNPDTAVASRG